MSYEKENLLSITLKKSTTEDLYRILCKEEESLSGDMYKLMLHLENYILKSSTIENMEEIFGKEEKE